MADKPREGDLVWGEGRNPAWFARMIGIWPGWDHEDSRGNADVLEVYEDDVLLEFYDGMGRTECVPLDAFSIKEDSIWKIRD